MVCCVTANNNNNIVNAAPGSTVINNNVNQNYGNCGGYYSARPLAPLRLNPCGVLHHAIVLSQRDCCLHVSMSMMACCADGGNNYAYYGGGYSGSDYNPCEILLCCVRPAVHDLQTG